MIEEGLKGINNDFGPNIGNEIDVSEKPKGVKDEIDVSNNNEALIKKVDDLCNNGKNIPLELLEEPVARERYLTILRENLEKVMSSSHHHKMDAIINEITRVSEIAEAKKYKEETSELDCRVEEMRNNGLSNKEIAKQFDEEYHIIAQSAHRLIVADRIESRKKRTKEVIEQLDNQVEQLRNQGLKNKEIAEKLDKEYYIIAQSAHRLIVADRIESQNKK